MFGLSQNGRGGGHVFVKCVESVGRNWGTSKVLKSRLPE